MRPTVKLSDTKNLLGDRVESRFMGIGGDAIFYEYDTPPEHIQEYIMLLGRDNVEVVG